MLFSVDDLIEVIEVEEKKAEQAAVVESSDRLIKTQCAKNSQVLTSRHVDILCNAHRVVKTSSLIWIR